MHEDKAGRRLGCSVCRVPSSWFCFGGDVLGDVLSCFIPLGLSKQDLKTLLIFLYCNSSKLFQQIQVVPL